MRLMVTSCFESELEGERFRNYIYMYMYVLYFLETAAGEAETD